MNFAPYFLLILLPMLLGLWAQFRVKSAFTKYSQIRASSNMTGADTARVRQSKRVGATSSPRAEGDVTRRRSNTIDVWLP